MTQVHDGSQKRYFDVITDLFLKNSKCKAQEDAKHRCTVYF